MDYEVVRGGHGEVRIFENHAVKVIENTYDGISLKELVLLKRLDHPQIVKCRGYEWTAREVEISMDLFDCDLEEYSKQFHPKEKIAMLDDLFRPLLSAMLYLKRARIVHMDIKPSNIFVRDGSLYLGDFSSACFEDSEPNFIATTREYIPPEGARVDYATDIYCLGITILEFIIDEFPKEFVDGRLQICGFDRVLRKYPSKLLRMLLPMVREDPLLRPTVEELIVKLGSKKPKPVKTPEPKLPPVDAAESMRFIEELERLFTFREELTHRRQDVADHMARLSTAVKEYVRPELVMPTCLFLVQILMDFPCFNMDLVLPHLRIPLAEVYRACEFLMRQKVLSSFVCD